MKSKIDYLKEMIDEPITSHGRYFMLFIQSLIVISIIAFTLETIPNRSELFYFSLYCIEVITIGVFTVEYVA